MKRLVILGAGTGGTTMANRLRRSLSLTEWSVTVVDRDDAHVYQPGLLFVPFGDPVGPLTRSRRRLLDHGIDLVLGNLRAVDAPGRHVHVDTQAGAVDLPWDLLIIATGCRVSPEETPGLTGVGWRQSASDFYTPEGASALARSLERMERGRVVINIAEMPIKCPVAPLEFAFLADHYFARRGLRKSVELVFATPLDGAFTKPAAARELGGLLERKGIRLETDFSVSDVDGERRVLRSYDGRELDYDLLVTIPLHRGAEVIGASGLGDSSAFVPTHKHTLAARGHDNIFVLGDATDLPTSKAGSVAHFQSDILVENVLCHLRGVAPTASYDGHANCFIETGYGKALLIDFNYDTEPLPGHFPLPGVGPFSLLAESEVNHWGKLAFRWTYWNLLVRGKELPISAAMPLAGKRMAHTDQGASA